VVTITDDGPGIPQQEIEVLNAESETQLEHGSGIGLWLVQWIIDRSNGTVEIESAEDGSTVKLGLLVASATESA
jgi:signal transduction histidine kinase